MSSRARRGRIAELADHFYKIVEDDGRVHFLLGSQFLGGAPRVVGNAVRLEYRTSSRSGLYFVTNSVAMSLFTSVLEALKNATEQGYEFDDWTDEDLADDLRAFDADIEAAPRSEIVDAVKIARAAP